MPETLPCYAFGPFLFDPAERRLSRDGRAVALPPKALDVLGVLVARAGHLVTKDEILRAVWPGVVVEESSLSVAVSRLRSALGAEGRAYVETIPGHGYRFVAPVTACASAGAPEPYPLTGDAVTTGPCVEDVVPTVTHSGDGTGGIARPPPQAPPPQAGPDDAGSIPTARPGRSPWRIGLLAGAGALALLAVALPLRGERAGVADVPGAATAPDPPAEALLAYRRARTLWASRHHETMPEALSLFQLARTLDSTFAAAYVGEAQVYAIWYRTGPAAEAALTRALALDPTLGEAWATLGFVRAFQAWDWTGAEAAFAHAYALDPDNVTTLQWLASLRMVQRRLPEAEAALRRALSLAPDFPALHADLCETLYYRRAYAEADAACGRALALDPAHPIARAHRLWRLGLTAPEGRAEATRALLRGRGGFDAFSRARLHARLGQQDSALHYVEQAVSQRVLVAPFLRPDPLFDFVRDDPRWIAAMHGMGLE